MSDRTPDDAVIVDRGYRHYEGERTGRRGAIAAIIKEGYRRVLGFRRKGRRKVLPWFFIILMLLSVVILVGITWAASQIPTPGDPTEFLPRYGEYFDFISVVALLFAAYVGPELLIPDRSQGVLNVYFSRPLSVTDYLVAKTLAYASIIMSFYLVPQLLFHLALAGLSPDGFISYITSTTDVLWRIPAAAFLFFLTHSSLAFMVAAFLNRVGAAAGVFLAGIFGSTLVALFFLEGTDAPFSRWATLLAFERHPRILRDWIFGIDTLDYIPELAGFEPIASLAVIVGLVLVAAVTLRWRYRNLT